MRPTLTLLFLKRALLLFWGLYFVLVLGSNVTDGLDALGVLEGFPFVSGNYALMEQVTGRYGTPGWITALLFAGVLAWEAAAAVLFLRAAAAFQGRDVRGRQAAVAAFAAGLGLWMAFVLADEFFIAFEIANLEGTHLGLFEAQLLSLFALLLLPDA